MSSLAMVLQSCNEAILYSVVAYTHNWLKYVKVKNDHEIHVFQPRSVQRGKMHQNVTRVTENEVTIDDRLSEALASPAHCSGLEEGNDHFVRTTRTLLQLLHASKQLIEFRTCSNHQFVRYVFKRIAGNCLRFMQVSHETHQFTEDRIRMDTV